MGFKPRRQKAMNSTDILNFSQEHGYQCCIEADESKNNEIILRINLSNQEDVNKYLEEFKLFSGTNWIRNGELKNPQRVLYHKYYVCQHSSVNKKRSLAESDKNSDCMATEEVKTKKKTTETKSTGCMATIDIKIKKITTKTRRNDEYLKRNIPLSGIIKFNLNHNHNTGISGSLKYLMVSEETKNTFEGYFESGMSPAEACRYHESLLLLDDKCWEKLADSSVNPTKNQLYYLHKKWTLKHFGNVFQPIPKLQEKKEFYQQSGIKIEIATDPWAVVVVTPIMQRAQELKSSKELIFCDSTSSCDATETTVTVLLTATKAGAIPIAVLLHDGQTTESYQQAFGLLKQSFPNAFGGNTEPTCIMTDDSRAEKTALKNTFPKSQQLLCFFHVLQKEWRWLCEKKNNVAIEKRQILMHLFRKIMYSESEEEVNEHMLKLQQEAKDYPNFWIRFEVFFSRGQEWLYLHRKHLLIRGNNTNNYAEVTIRILKDIILHRTKGYNCVALVDFIAFVWEEYFKSKLLDFAHDRRSKIKNNYFKLCSRVNLKPEDIDILEDGLYQISSSSNTFIKYIIDVPVGVCSCPAGINGSFCKHQAYLHKHLNIPFLNAPAINFQERASLGQLALGDKCPDPKWFLGLNELPAHNTNTEHSKNQDNQIYTSINATLSFIETPMEVDVNLEDDKNMKNIIKEINGECQRLNTLLKDLPFKVLERFVKRLKRIQTSPQLCSVIEQSKAARVKSNSKIKVQPTTASRRRPGVTRGSLRVPSGRPPCAKKRTVKRKHDINFNVSLNQRNATIHGRAH